MRRLAWAPGEQGADRYTVSRFAVVVAIVAVSTAAGASVGCGRDVPAPASGRDTRTPPSPLSEPVAIQALSDDLVARLKATPHAYFRFVNRAWVQAVCAAFSADVAELPAVRLHGDAHVEQYAVTDDAYGLDDFDDSATGPALIDVTRFLGSVTLVAHQRGWSGSNAAAIDAFLEGFRRALDEPGYVPPTPAVVLRLRGRSLRSREEFLAWAESLMVPLSPEESARVAARMKDVEAATEPGRRHLLRVKKAGSLHMGVGSALAQKILLRTQGPSAVDDDDLVIEAKEVTALPGGNCLTVPIREAYRPVLGSRQVGRLRHEILGVVPYLPGASPGSQGWWIRSWDASYREVEIDDLRSARELAEIARDAGAQLGSVSLDVAGSSVEGDIRQVYVSRMTRLEPRIRQVVADQTAQVLAAWRRFRTTQR